MWRELQRLSAEQAAAVVDITRQDYFELFSLPLSFEVDDGALTQAYKALQTQYHPDRVSTASDRERRQAMQVTSLLNEAYDTLRSPLKRAAYLLRLSGVDPEAHDASQADTAFLFRQLELRERLASLVASEDMEALEEMKADIGVERDKWLAEFAAGYAASNDEEIKPIYNKLQFLYKLLSEIDQAEETLLDY